MYVLLESGLAPKWVWSLLLLQNTFFQMLKIPHWAVALSGYANFHLHLILINCFECLDDVKPLWCYLILIFFSLNRTILNRCWILIFTHRFTLAEFLWNLGKKSFCLGSLDRGYIGPNILVKCFSRFHFPKYTYKPQNRYMREKQQNQCYSD